MDIRVTCEKDVFSVPRALRRVFESAAKKSCLGSQEQESTCRARNSTQGELGLAHRCYKFFQEDVST